MKIQIKVIKLLFMLFKFIHSYLYEYTVCKLIKGVNEFAVFIVARKRDRERAGSILSFAELT